MKAVGLDSCVVLRLLTGEPEAQAHVAKCFVEKCGSDQVVVCVSDLVVSEVYHALIYHYEVPKSQAAKAIYEFLSSSQIRAGGHAMAALADYRGSGAGLVDRMIRLDFLDHASEVVTFDSDFSRLENVRRLKT